jgi:hypothetical protein
MYSPSLLIFIKQIVCQPEMRILLKQSVFFFVLNIEQMLHL